MASPVISTTHACAIVAGPHDGDLEHEHHAHAGRRIPVDGGRPRSPSGCHPFGPVSTYCAAAARRPAGGLPAGGGVSGRVGQPMIPPGKFTPVGFGRQRRRLAVDVDQVSPPSVVRSTTRAVGRDAGSRRRRRSRSRASGSATSVIAEIPAKSATGSPRPPAGVGRPELAARTDLPVVGVGRARRDLGRPRWPRGREATCRRASSSRRRPPDDERRREVQVARRPRPARRPCRRSRRSAAACRRTGR